MCHNYYVQINPYLLFYLGLLSYVRIPSFLSYIMGIPTHMSFQSIKSCKFVWTFWTRIFNSLMFALHVSVQCLGSSRILLSTNTANNNLTLMHHCYMYFKIFLLFSLGLSSFIDDNQPNSRLKDIKYHENTLAIIIRANTLHTK